MAPTRRALCALFLPAMIPKHSNPFAVLNDTAIVSRSALRDFDDEDDLIPTDSGHTQRLAWLENILKRTIEGVLSPPSQVDGHQDGDAPRKKKRQKLDKGQKDAKERPEGDEETTAVCTSCPLVWSTLCCVLTAWRRLPAFRLFSGSAQPKSIVLVPKVQPWIAYVPCPFCEIL